MIGTLLLLTGVIAGAGIIATFWKEIVNWLKRILDKIKTMVQGTVEGFKVFFTRMQGMGKEISKNYVKVGTKWQETIVEKTVELSEIPKEYLDKMTISEREYYFTEELEQQLTQ